jgi:hypothetical protein
VVREPWFVGYGPGPLISDPCSLFPVFYIVRREGKIMCKTTEKNLWARDGGVAWFGCGIGVLDYRSLLLPV